jgi:iron complex outermembrane receptor protein
MSKPAPTRSCIPTLCRVACGALVAGAALQAAPAAAAPAANPSMSELTSLSLEELGNIEVTSVSRRKEQLNHAAASIYVITSDAIRRAGASTLPEALRLAPNLQIARLDASQYAISARGFNNAIGNKLLVLIDGRTVYAPFFSGVFWEQQDVMLQDVERIEVISGPGATLWGANAVNGVINIITRSAADTQGSLVALEAGDLDTHAAFRHGGALGENGHFRVYAKTMRLENTETAAGTSVADGWTRQQGGFRADWKLADQTFTLQGDVYEAEAEHRGFFGNFELTPISVSGANLLARWTRHLAGGSDLRVQAYYDRTKRDDAFLYRPEADIFDLEFQHGMKLDGHQIVWGGGHRQARDDIRPGLFFGFIPASRTMRWTNLFVQDEISLAKTLDLTVGAKLEHNDYTGSESLPSLRLSWKLPKGQLAWAALSRAVRAPARLDRELFLPPRPPFIIAGGPEFVSEVAKVLELGYRAQPTPALSYSATAFFHDWERLRSGQPPPNAHVQNMIAGHSYGVEAWATWQPAASWRLTAGLTTLRKKLALQPGSTDPVGARNLGNDPEFQWNLGASFNLSPRQELDVNLRHVGALPDPAVPAYTTVDLRYGWRMRRGLEVALIGRNLFDKSHPEFGAWPARSEIGRSLALRVEWAL